MRLTQARISDVMKGNNSNSMITIEQLCQLAKESVPEYKKQEKPLNGRKKNEKISKVVFECVDDAVFEYLCRPCKGC